MLAAQSKIVQGCASEICCGLCYQIAMSSDHFSDPRFSLCNFQVLRGRFAEFLEGQGWDRFTFEQFGGETKVNCLKRQTPRFHRMKSF